MAGEWKLFTMEMIAQRIAMGPFGSNIKTDNFVPSGVPIIRGGNLNAWRFRSEDFVFLTEEKADELKNANAFPDDIVITHRGTLGQVGIIPRKLFDRFVVSQSQLKITVNRSLADPDFIFYFFKSADGQYKLLTNVSQVGVPAISRPINSIKQISVNLPPLPTQRAIAHVLGTLDDLIELNRETNEVLEAMARALFESWFVDFDPVRAKAEGRAPAGMNAATAALFPDRFVESELGQIPEGWRVETVGDVCEINGWTLGKRDLIPDLEYVEISEVNRGNIGNMPVYQRGEEPSRARRRLRHGDTVVSTVRPDRGAYFLALNPPKNRIASTGFAVLTPKKVPWSVIHAAMTRKEVSDNLGHLADGGAYPAVRPEIVGGVEVVLPDDRKIMDAFHAMCASFFELAEDHRLESRDLAELRDTLLPKLLSGEVSPPEAAEAIEDIKEKPFPS